MRFGGLVGSFSAALARGALAGVWGAIDLGSGSGEWRVSREFPMLCQLLLHSFHYKLHNKVKAYSETSVLCDEYALRFAVL